MSEDVTVVELKKMCTEVLEKRARVDEAKDAYSKLNQECDDLENKLIDIMSTLDMKSFSESGMRFTRTEKYSITTPKGENKEVFFNYLKEIGHFEALATVHSNTLNSWYRSEDDAAKARGEPYAMIPGLDLPTARVGLTVAKTKN